MNSSIIKGKLNYLRRGLRFIQTQVPSLLPAIIFSAALKAVRPFIAILLTARIIDELFGARSTAHLVLLTGSAVGLNFIAYLLQKAMERIAETGHYRLEYIGMFAMDRLILSTDYEKTEHPDFHLKKQKIDEGANMNQRGTWQIPYLINDFVGSCCIVLLSVGLAFPLFFSFSSQAGSFIDSPWLSAIFLLLIAASSLYSAIANSRFTSWLFHKMDGMMIINRAFHFYTNMMKNHQLGKDVRIYGEQHLIGKAFDHFLDSDAPFMREVSGRQSRFRGIGAAISSLISGFIYLFVGLKAQAGLISIGSVVQYVGAISQFTTGFAQLISSSTDLWQNTEYVKLYFDFLDTPNPKHKGTLPVDRQSDNDCMIEFRHVSFKYPGSDTWALCDLSVKLSTGQHFAIVGRNGSGKTTFIKLLTRLYDPQEGEILLNGINIKKYDYQAYLSLFSVVFQDFQLFAFPIGQNVATSSDYNAPRVMNCLDLAGAGERIRHMSKGLKTPLYKVDADGVEISGGEAQKIAIARALYKDAHFVLLDEPTAALDPVAEFDVYSKFQSIAGGKTAIYISHRLSSCRFCDCILVFDKGRLIQSGTHRELLSHEDGQYYKLWNAQAQYYREQGRNEAGEAKPDCTP